MTVVDRTIRRVVWRRPAAAASDAPAPAAPARSDELLSGAPTFDIAPSDPIIALLQSASGAVELGQLELDSPALTEMRSAGITLVVPLVTNGELIGLLNVGPRLSDQGYSPDDRRLLETLGAQAAPAVRVGQLVREQEIEIRARGRLEQELQVAQLIQQNFLPKELPELDGWQVAAFYRPARTVGGDFYDFIDLPDGRIGLVIGDVTDKGIPAAMVMAATRSVLRASAQRLHEPGSVLARVNDSLCPDIPENMFVTCFYGVLDPATGYLRYANAGHNVPFVRSAGGESELRATGMPLGLMPGMNYEEREATLEPGASVLLYSDGLVEAHGADREMFGNRRAADLLTVGQHPQAQLDALLLALDGFTGDEEEQEDDITLVAIRRSAGGAGVIADFEVVSAPGNERDATRRVAESLAPYGLAPSRLEALKTATAEATMNAMEHGNTFDPALLVHVVVLASDTEVSVRITDQGSGQELPEVEAPDIDAKLDGRQSPRGWGLFLIERLVDEVRQSSDGAHHTLELIMRLEGGDDAVGRS
jgi:serine phosphatase RsbU (regulator of sigma subunit)/anti-sigma regulatory factor (Ser/Thr protein kinase)